MTRWEFSLCSVSDNPRPWQGRQLVFRVLLVLFISEPPWGFSLGFLGLPGPWQSRPLVLVFLNQEHREGPGFCLGPWKTKAGFPRLHKNQSMASGAHLLLNKLK